ncbi:MAG: hypothetical protein JSS20_19580, partial [Proteobacteria bacterium]|nr:hypothetical protein [Pseudomonadota bacterium]
MQKALNSGAPDTFQRDPDVILSKRDAIGFFRDTQSAKLTARAVEISFDHPERAGYLHETKDYELRTAGFTTIPNLLYAAGYQIEIKAHFVAGVIFAEMWLYFGRKRI